MLFQVLPIPRKMLSAVFCLMIPSSRIRITRAAALMPNFCLISDEFTEPEVEAVSSHLAHQLVSGYQECARETMAGTSLRAIRGVCP